MSHIALYCRTDWAEGAHYSEVTTGKKNIHATMFYFCHVHCYSAERWDSNLNSVIITVWLIDGEQHPTATTQQEH